MPTIIPFGDPRAQKKWAASLFIDTMNNSYWQKKFMGQGDGYVIQQLTDLESAAGDTIQYDLSIRLRAKPTYGDDTLEGKEEALRFYSDQVKIDQMRHAVDVGGTMTRKRTAHNLRNTGKGRLSEYWSKFVDQMLFIYASGARGINANFYEDVAWVGHAQNPIEAPDAGHILYAGAANTKAGMAATDKMTKSLIERAEVKASMMSATDPANQAMMPVMINGESHYVCVMSKLQAHDLRTADTSGWMDIQKAAVTAEGRNNPIFKGGLGMIKNVVLHEHEDVIRFADYGAGANVAAARALFLSRQACVIAFGASGGMRFSWKEEGSDYGNKQKIAAGIIAGVKKTRFNGKDYGVIALDTAAADPNA